MSRVWLSLERSTMLICLILVHIMIGRVKQQPFASGPILFSLSPQIKKISLSWDNQSSALHTLTVYFQIGFLLYTLRFAGLFVGLSCMASSALEITAISSSQPVHIPSCLMLWNELQSMERTLTHILAIRLCRPCQMAVDLRNSCPVKAILVRKPHNSGLLLR